MKKKLIFFVFIFVCLSLCTNARIFAFDESSIRVSEQTEGAKENSVQSPLLTQTSSEQNTEPVEYVLPYPGILPDHPLYLFKTIRDAMLEFFINTPAKKTELYLLQSDKHLSMTLILVNEKKYDIARTTLEKSSDYFQKALTQLGNASRGTSGHLVSQMKLSAAKHIQVLGDISATKELLPQATEAQKIRGLLLQKLEAMEK
jgi:hypothetical protein